MDQSLAKRTLQDLIKREDIKNKTCVDCGNPNPQWASLRFVLLLFSGTFSNRCYCSQLRRIYLPPMRWASQRFRCAHQVNSFTFM